MSLEGAYYADLEYLSALEEHQPDQVQKTVSDRYPMRPAIAASGRPPLQCELRQVGVLQLINACRYPVSGAPTLTSHPVCAQEPVAAACFGIQSGGPGRGRIPARVGPHRAEAQKVKTVVLCSGRICFRKTAAMAGPITRSCSIPPRRCIEAGTQVISQCTPHALGAGQTPESGALALHGLSPASGQLGKVCTTVASGRSARRTERSDRDISSR